MSTLHEVVEVLSAAWDCSWCEVFTTFSWSFLSFRTLWDVAVLGTERNAYGPCLLHFMGLSVRFIDLREVKHRVYEALAAKDLSEKYELELQDLYRFQMDAAHCFRASGHASISF